MQERIARLKTYQDACQMAKNAESLGRPDVAAAALARAAELRAIEDGFITPAEQAIAAAVYAYEDRQSELTGRDNYKANRTWPMLRKNGSPVRAVEELIIHRRPTPGYEVLAQANLKHHSFEAVILRFPGEFSEDAVVAARARLSEGREAFPEAAAEPVRRRTHPVLDAEAQAFLHGFNTSTNWCRNDWLPRYRESLAIVQNARSDGRPADVFELLWKKQDNSISHAGLGLLKSDVVDDLRDELIVITADIFNDGRPNQHHAVVKRFEAWRVQGRISMVPRLLIARVFAAIHPDLYHTTVDNSSHDEVLIWFKRHTGFVYKTANSWAEKAHALVVHLDEFKVFGKDLLARNIFPWFVIDQLRAGDPGRVRPGHRPRAESSFAYLPAQEREIALRHNALLTKLYAQLVEEYGEPQVFTEYPTGTGGYADAVVRFPDGQSFVYELKIAPTASLVVRQAMGQLLDYGYRGEGLKPKGLFAVGEPILDSGMQTYLERLRSQFGLNIQYLQVS
ncbi:MULTISPECIES: hypothetical protein [Achromobacter]|uniref:Uncharacterized protein n=1 Tax=Achromobacter spanius TaxID=217203 RepID=A0ABY8GVX2_9BURK|nr:MULTISPECIES: hypothetical protein [Achromobacter]WAI81752.1 hypothetical protein N8Z00_19730 [Achromobacter spanius]WEX97270.1 hypothetical protein N3Z32_14340 [Achromobacter sp. SS2-2022]WFP09014.1 hypothetical protein P8T11_03775 [Achromobacter spanius]